jgi:hypothetical protein
MHKIIFGVLLLVLSFGVKAQTPTNPTYQVTGVFKGKSIPLRDLPKVEASEARETSELKIIRNRMRAPRKVVENALPLHGDPSAQMSFGALNTLALEESFDGSDLGEGQAVPPDPSGAAGPNHYVHAVNLVIKIFDKEGNLLTGPSPLSSIWGNGVNNGDPIILYDQLADRWFLSQFNTATNGLLIAISETSDPTGAYFTYEFPLDSFPDYPHYSVWDNAYFMTANKNSGANTYALDRIALLNGDPNPQLIGFNLPGIEANPNTVFSPEPANLLGTAIDANTPGYIVYLQDDGWSPNILNDHLKIWEIELDWFNASNSTISDVPLELATVPFESTFAPFGTGDVNQPGTTQKIDMIGGVISYMTNFRKFDTHNSMIITFNVDVSGTDRSGIRWFELRNTTGTPWTIFQEGTYAPNDGASRFMGSAAIDAKGNIGLAFNIASSTVPVSIRYTGRFKDDPAGTMTIAETTIVNGSGVQTNTNRFGDYSHLTMDPDNFTFWHTAEYFSQDNFWTTRIASFSLSPGFDNDIGVANIVTPDDGILSNSETVEVTIRNYGQLQQSNFNVELRLDGALVATQLFSGTIDAESDASFVFTQTVNSSNAGQTYELSAKTTLATDEFTINDEYVKDVKHLLANDIGVTSIDSPATGEGLGNEVVSVIIENFGANPQSNFDMSYSFEGGTPVVETITNTINSLESFTYNFTETVDASQLGDYTIIATTLLNNDQEVSNNEITKQFSHEQCDPESNCADGDGFNKFEIGTISNEDTNCSPNGYVDFTNLSTDLNADVPIDVTVASGFGDQLFSVFIDFNDNFVFEIDELVITDEAIATSNTDVTVQFTLPDDSAIAGTHLLRARAGWSQSEPTTADGCVDFTYGETEDYTVNVMTTLSIQDDDFNTSNLLIYPTSEGTYEVNLAGNANFGDLDVEVYNTLGQIVLSSDMNQSGNSYKTTLDFTNKADGFYLVKVFNGTLSTVKKVVVK